MLSMICARSIFPVLLFLRVQRYAFPQNIQNFSLVFYWVYHHQDREGINKAKVNERLCQGTGEWHNKADHNLTFFLIKTHKSAVCRALHYNKTWGAGRCTTRPSSRCARWTTAISRILAKWWDRRIGEKPHRCRPHCSITAAGPLLKVIRNEELLISH